MKEHKLMRPFHGLCRVLKVTPNNAEVVLVDKPREDSIFVKPASLSCRSLLFCLFFSGSVTACSLVSEIFIPHMQCLDQRLLQAAAAKIISKKCR